MTPLAHGAAYGAVIVTALLSIVALAIWFERKFAGRMQSRLGPTIVGPVGLLQPIADVLKLLQKEDIVPADADHALFNAAPVLAVHACAGLFLALGVGAVPWFINGGLQKYQMLQTTFGAVTNIALNIVMIPRYGALGASVVTVVSFCVSSVVVNAFSQKTRRVFVMQVMALNPWLGTGN